MNRLPLGALAGLALTFTACGQVETTTSYGANLSGANQRPVVTTSATGQTNLTLRGRTLTVLGTFEGLSSAVTVAHIHGPADENTNAPVLLPLVIDQVTNGSRSGRISGTFTLTDQQVQWLDGRQLYVNVHSQTYPNGEIRGQIGKFVQ
ncbi:CHRD domain-containing protein [Deinococcus planocerae]|uniref:CHRD domain-containing protein n=1 Tax=Deinococcus planocerae TaxID=1737569 RepID=UPI000C7F4026|nr:CHRD domain-containing protein [Deinococcus planocerae]